MNYTNSLKKINKILIAEDNDESSFYLKLILSPLCTELILVKTGKDAVEVCKNNPDIQVVLMDIQMPDLDGFEATRQIRLFNSEVIIIAQTAFAFSDDRKKALAAGCNDYLSKPFRKDDMLQLINLYFNK
jgi:CheY-like chemotaxis protein